MRSAPWMRGAPWTQLNSPRAPPSCDARLCATVALCSTSTYVCIVGKSVGLGRVSSAGLQKETVAGLRRGASPRVHAEARHGVGERAVLLEHPARRGTRALSSAPMRTKGGESRREYASAPLAVLHVLCLLRVALGDPDDVARRRALRGWRRGWWAPLYFDVKEQPGAARTRSPHPGLDIDAEVGVGLEGERGEVGRAGVEPRAVCRRNAAARRLVGDEGRGEGERWDVKSVLCAGRQCGGLVSEMAPVRVLTGAEKRERGEREK